MQTNTFKLTTDVYALNTHLNICYEELVKFSFDYGCLVELAFVLTTVNGSNG